MEWGASPWDLHRRGLQDARRHDERVREALRRDLPRLITEEALITRRGDRPIRIPVRYLDLFRFRYADEEAARGVGHGPGQEGDVWAREERPGPQPGDLPGDRPGREVYEAEFTVDEVAALMMEDLELPWLEPAAAGPVPSPAGRVRDVQRRGPWSNLDRRRTLYRHMRRRAARGDAVPLSFHDDDLRFRVWAPDHRRAAQAAVYLLMDRSGSMSTERRYIAKAFFFWLVTFLRRRYTHVDVVFIAHDTEAYVVPEEQFFAFSSSGGTCSSSAYLAALEHIHRRHPPEGWNNYAFHFTDGENFPGDNEKAVEAARRLLQVTRMVGCGEIVYDSWHQFQAGKEPVVTRRSSLFRALDELDHPRLILCTIGSRSDVQRAMRELLSVQGGRGER